MKSKILLFSFFTCAMFLFIAATPISNLLLQSNMNAGGYGITNLATPANTNDAATKGYVDSHSGGGASNAVTNIVVTSPLTGGTITNTGTIGFNGTLPFNASGATNLSGSNIASGTVATNWLSQNGAYLTNVMAASMPYSGLTSLPSWLTALSANNGSNLTNVTAASIPYSGITSIPVWLTTLSTNNGGSLTNLQSSSLIGLVPFANLQTNGSYLTNLTSANLTGLVPFANLQTNGSYLTNLNGANIASGTISSSRLPSDGSYLTNLNAGNLASGTIATNRLPQIPLAQISTNGATTGQVPTFTNSTISWQTPPSGGSSSVPPGVQNFRLTLTSGTPVTTSDVTAATTIYLTPYVGNYLGLYYNSAWSVYSTSEISIAVPSTTNTVYDVFAYYTGSAVALELTAWSSTTARATSLARVNGILVKSTDTTRRFLGTFMTTSTSGQTVSSVTNRYLQNYYNTVPMGMGFNNWSSHIYATSSWREWNGGGSRLEFVTCYDTTPFMTTLVVRNNGGAPSVAMNINNTSGPGGMVGTAQFNAYIGNFPSSVSDVFQPAAGYNYVAALESGQSGSGSYEFVEIVAMANF